uniref:Uncharacterized protein n=1 Tax=Oryza meridionalis TaxID=40149 RepID=A0A0E0DQV2_9ORYZ
MEKGSSSTPSAANTSEPMVGQAAAAAARHHRCRADDKLPALRIHGAGSGGVHGVSMHIG